jgi:hypothetical protein
MVVSSKLAEFQKSNIEAKRGEMKEARFSSPAKK